MLYIPESESHSRTLAKRVERGTLRRLARGVYSDDFERIAAEQVAEQILAICGRLFPDGYVSHSSAALRAPVDGLLFLSQAARAGGPRELPGVKVVRLPALP